MGFVKKWFGVKQQCKQRQHCFYKGWRIFSNNNVHSFWHHFLALSFMPFHMVWSILNGVLTLKTITKFQLKLQIGCWRISRSQKVVSGVSLRTKKKMSCERAWNSVEENSLKNCVHFCLSLFVLLERYGWIAKMADIKSRGRNFIHLFFSFMIRRSAFDLSQGGIL